MTVTHVQARPAAYADSVTLMQVSKEVAAADGVEAALVAMATELNLGLLAGMGFARPAAAGPNDLLVAVRARDADALANALAVVEQGLSSRRPAAVAAPDQAPPRTVSAALRRSGPALVLVSTPGQHAFTEAMEAIDAGCDVMIFSDNVPVEQEIQLKDAAAAQGVLVLGPDCGTAVVDGVGLGFAHSLSPGPVGVVAASGTGAQQVLCLLDAAGVGISATLGVGGRDLSRAVAGRSTRAALAALDEDPATELIIVVSKPPDAEVAAQMRKHANSLRTPVHFALVGPGHTDLTAATEEALRHLGVDVPRWRRWQSDVRSGPGALRGLFAGGTLCDEAMSIAAERLGPVLSNIPLDPAWGTDPHHPAAGHVMIDFGDDGLTAGRPHPMIDSTQRLARLTTEAADPATSVVLLDVVLGHGAHPDPAAELAPAVAAASQTGRVTTVISLIGANGDPQGLEAQATTLQAAGGHVFASNAQATRFACDVASGRR